MVERRDSVGEASASGLNQPKYLHIVETLRKGLLSGQYLQGVRLPSEAELSRRFKVSRMTVVKAIHQLQQEGLVVRRVGSGTYAAKPARTDGQTFGLLIPDLGKTEIFEPICRGMMRSPLARRHSLLWGHSFADVADKGEQAKQLCLHFLEQNVNGVFFAPLEYMPGREKVNSEILNQLDKAKVPVVLLDRHGLGSRTASSHDLISLNNQSAGYAVTEHLLRLGVRRIGFLAREGSVETVEARIRGCREALFDCGGSLQEVVLVQEDEVDTRTVQRLLEARLEAVVCANDRTAASLIKAMLEHGLSVPRQLRIVGFDDVSYASLLPVPLTTVHQPCAEIGAVALAAMLDRINSPELPPRSILLEGRLVVRVSCGGASA